MKKFSKEVKFTLHNEEVLTVKDEDNGAYGSSALAEFLNKNTAKLVIEGKDIYVPFHAVIKVEVATTETEVDDPEDANCNKTCECADDTTTETDGD